MRGIDTAAPMLGVNFNDKDCTKCENWRGELHHFDDEVKDVAFGVLENATLRSDNITIFGGGNTLWRMTV